ncbi:MAG: hypothetical protein P3C10_14860 [Gemmatimonadota bacterium]|nr:hypothetical protein [Gemmatimonadota bacterium]
MLLATAVLAVGAGRVDGSTAAVRRPAREALPAVRDPVAHFQAQLDAGEVVLAHDSALGYLPAVLTALHIPVSSQALVFSRTSLQTDKITPWSPRAIYFSDDVYIGYVQESTFLEIAAVDPVYGAVFYTLSQEPRARPVFSRETTTCLMCHQSRLATGRDTTAGVQPGGGPAARLRRDVERLVRAMLFVGEAPFDGPVRGTTTFAADFPQAGPRDARGRSLRDLDLTRRLFTYPLSFLIYSDSFDALPALAKGEVYRQLDDVLGATHTPSEFAHLQPADRTAILQILTATKPDFAAWRRAAGR